MTSQTSHITSIATYTVIFILLLVLLGLTVAVAAFDLGAFGTVVAMAVAVTKALLIILYFMHVRHSSSLTRVFVVGGFLWLAILLALVLSDYFTRQPPSITLAQIAASGALTGGNAI